MIRVAVAQKGAREHFLVPRALEREGALAVMVTDWLTPQNPCLVGIARIVGGAAARSIGAYRAPVPRDRIRALRGWGLRSRVRLQLASRFGDQRAATLHSDVGFARRVAGMELPEHNAFFGYSYASLEAIEAARERGAFVVLDQLDPGPEEHRLIEEEEARFPEFVDAHPGMPEVYFERVKREWSLADLILVNSEWSRDCIVRHGAEADKIAVLPLAYEDDITPEPPRPAGSPVRVLWLGRVALQKGISYLLEAARLMADQPVEFRIAGRLDIREDVLRRASGNIRWLGKLSREDVMAEFRSADLFALPTLSDGFAITQLEAMAHGVPVVATVHCGRVVRDGKNGFVVPARNAQALCSAVSRFVDNPESRVGLSENASRTARSYSLERFSTGLIGLLREHIARRDKCKGSS